MFGKLMNLFKSEAHQLRDDQRGITALETAIILIAFVVAATVFAFTILSAGTFSTERGREAVYAGLEGVSSSMEVAGSVIGMSMSNTHVNTITFNLASVAGGSGVNITSTIAGGDNNVVVMSYQDEEAYVPELEWALNWIVGDDDDILEPRELVEIIVVFGPASQGIGNDNGITLTANSKFRIEIKPPQGGVLPIVRTTPPWLDDRMSLD